jgi:ribosomal protein S1
MLYAFTVIPDWGKKVQETYPMGSIINNAKVTDIVGSGVLVELEAGIKGLLRNTDMTSEVQPGALITVTVLKIDLESQRIALAMGEKYLDKMLVPQTKVPLVIGKKGSVIKNIMEQTGTSIDNSPAENNQVEFLICGDTLYDVQQAKAKIESIIIRPNR